jgi:hypothetical protein
VTAADVLRQARAANVELSATSEGKLRWRSPARLTDDLHKKLTVHKAELLELLQRPTLLPHGFVWDAAAAEVSLVELRAEISRVETELGGALPEPLATLLADAVVIGKRYISNHELEARRGWDAMELLRDLLPHVRMVVANWKKQHQA